MQNQRPIGPVIDTYRPNLINDTLNTDAIYTRIIFDNGCFDRLAGKPLTQPDFLQHGDANAMLAHVLDGIVRHASCAKVSELQQSDRFIT